MKKLLAILLVLCFATPALAQNWHFYGSLRTHLAFYDIDEDYLGGPAMENALGADDSGALLGLSGQSRLGLRGQATENLWGLVELGFRDTTREDGQLDTSGNSKGVYTRLAYGNWNFGAGNLIVGKDYTPGTFLGYSNMIGDIGDQGGANMLVGGLPYIGRQPQVKLQMGDFSAALIQRNKAMPASPTASALLAGLGVDDLELNGEDYIPRIEAAYVHRLPMVNIRGVAGFQSYDMQWDSQLAGISEDETVISFLLGIGASFNLDPAYVKGTVSYMQNPGNYGISNVMAPLARDAVGDEDAESWQATLVAGYKFTPAMTGEIGFAYTMNEVDDFEQDGWLAYAQLPVFLDRGMTLTPEFGFVSQGDLEDDGNVIAEFGEMMYFALEFRVDF